MTGEVEIIYYDLNRQATPVEFPSISPPTGEMMVRAASLSQLYKEASTVSKTSSLSRRRLITAAAVGMGVITNVAMAAEPQQKKLTIDEKNKEKGIFGQRPSADTYEVKSYVVQSDFDLSTSKMPNAFSIFLIAVDGHGGRVWFKRTPEAITAMTYVMDKAFASGQKVYYSYETEQLAVGSMPFSP